MIMTKINKHYYKICPRCGSHNVTFNDQGMGIGPMGDKCYDCGFGREGLATFPEVEEKEVEHFREQVKKKR